MTKSLSELLAPSWHITKREVRDQFRDWRIIFPVVGLTVIFPFLMNFTAQQMLGFVQQYGANLIGERMVPFLLMIVGFFPTSSSLVIALETFVGEKERGSIEPLLNTPLEDWQIYLGKLLSATVPPLAGSFLGMAVYLAGIAIKGIPIPQTELLILIIILTIVQTLMMVSGAVVVSSQATSVRAANLLASFIVIPVAFLIQGESIVMFWGHSFRTLWWAVLGLSILTILLVRVGLAHFRREELLGKEIDVLNIKWLLLIFKSGFTFSAKNLFDWYRKLFTYLKTIRVSFLIISMMAIIAVIIGADRINQFPVNFKDSSFDLSGNMQSVIDLLPLFSAAPVLSIFWQNSRVMLIAFILGLFSLGILGVLPFFISIAVIGYLGSIFISNGVSPVEYLALVLPHGIIEIPAAIIATAVVLRSGAILATPSPDQTFGEVVVKAIGEWTATMLGIVLPLLLIASCIEAWITPRLVLMIFG